MLEYRLGEAWVCLRPGVPLPISVGGIIRRAIWVLVSVALSPVTLWLSVAA